MAAPIVPILFGTLLVGAGIGGTVYLQRQDEKKKKEKAKKKKKKSGTNGNGNGNGKTDGKQPVYAENAALGNSPEVVGQVSLPIELGELGPINVRMPKTGNVVTYKTLAIRSNEVIGDGKKLTLTPKQALEGLVTNMSPYATKKVWESLKQDVKVDGGVTFDMPSQSMDNVLMRVLGEVMPSTDWSKKLSPFGANSPQVMLWIGATLLGELLYQSVWNDYAEEQDQKPAPTPGPTPEPMPGGSGNAQVDAQWDTFYNKGELEGVPKVAKSANYGPTPKGFFGQIKVFEDDVTRGGGVYTGVLNYDSPTDDGLIILTALDLDKLMQTLINVAAQKEATL